MTTPTYQPTQETANKSDVSANTSDVKDDSQHSHHFERPHRAPGQLELGFTDILEGQQDKRQVVASAGISESKIRYAWEARRPQWLAALLAEVTGVFIYCLLGELATATVVLTAAAKENQGDILMIGFAYAVGIAMAIIVASTTSGGHLSPCVTLAQWLYKGFPARNVPFYIAAQILGSMLASLVVYGIYKTEMTAMATGLDALGLHSQIFSAQGPAGILALFPVHGKTYGAMWLSEAIGSALIAIVIFANIDPSNPFTSAVAGPWNIALAYAGIIWGLAPVGSLAANTARDLGSRFVCGMFYGRECFPAKYSALAALTNIPVTLVTVGVYVFMFSDSRRAPASQLLSSMAQHETQKQQEAIRIHDELLDQKIDRVVSSGGDASALMMLRSRSRV